MTQTTCCFTDCAVRLDLIMRVDTAIALLVVAKETLGGAYPEGSAAEEKGIQATFPATFAQTLRRYIVTRNAGHITAATLHRGSI